MSAWTAFGFGILLGALLLDQLWRWLYRVSRKLIAEQGEYIAELEAASGMEARQGGNEVPCEARQPDGEAGTP